MDRSAGESMLTGLGIPLARNCERDSIDHASNVGMMNEGGRDRNRERLLVQLWTDAAVAIRRADREFSQHLQLKAEYWANPNGWTADDVERAGIQIEAVSGKARSLLGGAI